VNRPLLRYLCVLTFLLAYSPISIRAAQAGQSELLAYAGNVIPRFGYTRRAVERTSLLLDAPASQSLGLPGIPPVANFRVADSLNRGLERDVSNGDMPNVFVASFTYELPFGAGRLFRPTGVGGKILDGWELSGTINLQGLIFENTGPRSVADQREEE
jgi:hypothetical protein